MTEKTSNYGIRFSDFSHIEQPYQSNLQELAHTVNQFITDVSSFGATKGVLEISQSICDTLFGKNSRYSQAFQLIKSENNLQEIDQARSLDYELKHFYFALSAQVPHPQWNNWTRFPHSQWIIWSDPIFFFLYRGFAKISAHFLEQALFFLLQDWKTILEKDVNSFVKENEHNDFESLRTSVCSHLTRYVQEAEKAYQEVLQTNPKNSEVDTLVQNKLAHLTGQDQQDLYNTLSHWFLTKYPPSLFFCKIIDYELSRIRFSNTPIFSYANRVLAIVTKTFSILMQCFLTLPEKCCNRLIQYKMESYMAKKIQIQIDKYLTTMDREKIQKNLLRNILDIVKKPDDPDLAKKTLPKEETKKLQNLVEQAFDLIDYQNVTSLQAAQERRTKRGSKNDLVPSSYLSEIGLIRTFLQFRLADKGGKILANQMQKEQLLRLSIKIIPKIYEEILNIDFSKKDTKTIESYLTEILTTLINTFSQEKTGFKFPGIHTLIEKTVIPTSITQEIAKPLLTLATDPKHHVYGVIHPLMQVAVRAK